MRHPAAFLLALALLAAGCLPVYGQKASKGSLRDSQLVVTNELDLAALASFAGATNTLHAAVTNEALYRAQSAAALWQGLYAATNAAVTLAQASNSALRVYLDTRHTNLLDHFTQLVLAETSARSTNVTSWSDLILTDARARIYASTSSVPAQIAAAAAAATNPVPAQIAAAAAAATNPVPAWIAARRVARLETSSGYNGIDVHRHVWSATGSWTLAVPGQGGYTSVVADAGILWPWPDPTEPVLWVGDYSIYTSSYYPLPTPGAPVYFFPVIDIFGPDGASWSASGTAIRDGQPWSFEFDTLSLPLIDGPDVGPAYLSWATDNAITNIGMLALTAQIIDPAAASFFGVDSGGPVEIGSPSAVTSVGDWDFDGDVLSNPAGTVDASAFKLNGNPLIISPTNNPAFTGTLTVNGSPIGEITPTYIGIATAGVITVSSGSYYLDLTDWPATGSTWAASVEWDMTPELTVTGRYEFAFSAVGAKLRGRQVWPSPQRWEHVSIGGTSDSDAPAGAFVPSFTLKTAASTNSVVLVGHPFSSPTLIELSVRAVSLNPLGTVIAFGHAFNSYSSTPSESACDYTQGASITFASSSVAYTTRFIIPTRTAQQAWLAMRQDRYVVAGSLRVFVVRSKRLTALEVAAWGDGWRP